MKIDTTNMCSPLQKKLLELDGIYYHILQAIQQDDTLTTVVRSRQLHIYRNGKKILVLAGKAQPKIIREDELNTLLITQLEFNMTGKEQALFALMQDMGYSHGLCVTALQILSQSQLAVSDMIAYIYDEQPTEQELIAELARICDTD